MCTYSQHIILAQTDFAQISWCKGCKSYSLIYNNCALSFTPGELQQFQEMLGQLREHDYNYQFMGQSRVLIHNQCAHMGICFTSVEVSEIRDLIAEALTLFEAFSIIYA